MKNKFEQIFIVLFLSIFLPCCGFNAEQNKQMVFAKKPYRQAKPPVDAIRNQIADTALKFLGTRYLYGGKNKSSGVDCSGFVSLVFHEFGIQLPRMARIQSKIGRTVRQKDLRKADLVFFRMRGHLIDHIGIFIGNNNFIHASKSAGEVRISSLKNPFWQKCFSHAKNILD